MDASNAVIPAIDWGQINKMDRIGMLVVDEHGQCWLLDSDGNREPYTACVKSEIS